VLIRPELELVTNIKAFYFRAPQDQLASIVTLFVTTWGTLSPPMG